MKNVKILKQSKKATLTCLFPNPNDRRTKFIVQSVKKPSNKRTLYSLPSANKIYEEMN